MEITPDFLIKRNILFVVSESLGIQVGEYVEEGAVISVDKDQETATVCFIYHGYKSATEEVPFSHIYSVEDLGNGTFLHMCGFKGNCHDLRDKAPFGTHKIPEVADD
tara:strand:- start:6259 stop:6579 length:321 start_codon:yes stop_codon:yes gene_type:complete